LEFIAYHPSGIQPGDILVAVDGVSVEGQDLESVAKLLRKQPYAFALSVLRKCDEISATADASAVAGVSDCSWPSLSSSLSSSSVTELMSVKRDRAMAKVADHVRVMYAAYTDEVTGECLWPPSGNDDIVDETPEILDMPMEPADPEEPGACRMLVATREEESRDTRRGCAGVVTKQSKQGSFSLVCK
jgi:hypothetical protein